MAVVQQEALVGTGAGAGEGGTGCTSMSGRKG